ncbi:hypothetical protein J6590_055883 [Homalodisca vitripennis]|nr:hypothetical protein J6590_055883 [Homalodisca vitripennis]
MRYSPAKWLYADNLTQHESKEAIIPLYEAWMPSHPHHGHTVLKWLGEHGPRDEQQNQQCSHSSVSQTRVMARLGGQAPSLPLPPPAQLLSHH